MVNISQNQKENEMQFITIPKNPFEIFYIDHFGPLQQTEDNFKFVFVIVDAFTRFTWLHSTKSTSSKEVFNFLKLLFDIFGLPKEVISDRGTAFTSRKFNAMVNTNNIIYRKIVVAAPWTNSIRCTNMK